MKKTKVSPRISFSKFPDADGTYVCSAHALVYAVKGFVNLHFPESIEIISCIKEPSTLHIKMIPNRLANLLNILLQAAAQKDKILIEASDTGKSLKLELKLEGNKPFGKRQINLIKNEFESDVCVISDKSIVVYIAHEMPSVITTSAIVVAFIMEELERIFFG